MSQMVVAVEEIGIKFKTVLKIFDKSFHVVLLL